MASPFIVGITGASGSGKTTFINSLVHLFEASQVCLISQDHYYKPQKMQPVDDEGVENYDTPESLEIEQFIKDIITLKNGNAVQKMEYNFNNPEIKTSMLTFLPTPVIIVEGIFIFHFPEIATLIDLKIFIETKEHLRIKRRILRDSTERGYPLDEILYRMEKQVEPAFKKYVERYKDEADIVIPNNENFKNALEVLSGFLKNRFRTGSDFNQQQ